MQLLLIFVAYLGLRCFRHGMAHAAADDEEPQCVDTDCVLLLQKEMSLTPEIPVETDIGLLARTQSKKDLKHGFVQLHAFEGTKNYLFQTFWLEVFVLGLFAFVLLDVLPFFALDIYFSVLDRWRATKDDHQEFFTTQELLDKKVFTPDVGGQCSSSSRLCGMLKPSVSNDEGLGSRQATSVETRMTLNGETRAQMKHAMELKGDGTWDTTVDQEWFVDPTLAFNDTYVLFTSALWIIPKFVLFAVPLFVTIIPYFLVIKIYQCCIKAPTDVVRRNRWTFFIFVELLGRTFLFVPCILTRLALWCDYFFYYLFSIIFLVAFNPDGWLGYCKSRLILGPYEGGPHSRLTDLMVCSVGQVARNGLCECAKTFAGTYLLLPWLKYYVNANPFIYPLEERFVQQISTSMQDLGLAKATDAAREIISRTKQAEDFVPFEHQWDFIPHYPYPPPGRRWANGIQHVGKYFELHVHTTHAHSEASESWEQFVVSNSVAVPVYRVMLWYNNPYHFFTGFVEASITSGLPSQPNKKYGGEHPMWLITSRSPLLAGRDSATGAGMIDAFFDYWLPDFVDGVRFLVTRDPEKVLKYHREVVSQDGISHVDNTAGAGLATLDKLEKAGIMKKRKCATEGCEYCVTGVTDDMKYCCSRCRKKSGDHGQYCQKVPFVPPKESLFTRMTSKGSTEKIIEQPGEKDVEPAEEPNT